MLFFMSLHIQKYCFGTLVTPFPRPAVNENAIPSDYIRSYCRKVISLTPQRVF